MRNIIAAVGVLLSATPTLADLQIGQCTTELYEVYQGGPLPGEPTVGQTGIPMNEGILVVTNPNEFALGSWVTIPSLYGGRKFQVITSGNSTSGNARTSSRCESRRREENANVNVNR